MHTSSRLKSLPGILFALLVVFFALGNSWLDIYPYGYAVWFRPLLGLLGIAGAICLFAGKRPWLFLLPLWCLLQTFIIATDASREWFYQGIMWGQTATNSVRSNHVLMSYSSSGINFAGPVLCFIVVVIIIFHLHPRFSPLSSAQRKRNGKILVAFLACFTIFASAGFIRSSLTSSDSDYTLNLDLPRVPIYYKDQFLGRTPLIINAAFITEHKLPLDPAANFKLFTSGWMDNIILSDGKTAIPLYASTPWPFQSYTDTFASPWGPRARAHYGDTDTRNIHGYIVPAAARRDEPIFTIQITDTLPLPVGSPLHLHCVLNNPTSEPYVGGRAVVERHCFSFDHFDLAPSTAPYEQRHRELPMAAAWHNLMPGDTVSADVTVDSPSKPGDYELFCTWFIYGPDEKSGAGNYCSYSNMLWLPVK